MSSIFSPISFGDFVHHKKGEDVTLILEVRISRKDRDMSGRIVQLTVILEVGTEVPNRNHLQALASDAYNALRDALERPGLHPDVRLVGQKVDEGIHYTGDLAGLLAALQSQRQHVPATRSHEPSGY